MGGGASKSKAAKAPPAEGLNDPLFNTAEPPLPERQTTMPAAPNDPLSKYQASAAPEPTADAALLDDTPVDDAPDVAPSAVALGVQLNFAGPTGSGKSIARQSTAGGLVDDFGSLKPSDGQSVMSRVDLGALHAELQAFAVVTFAQFETALQKLLAGADAPPAGVISALFRAFDADGSGEVDQKELIAGCQALCSGDESAKLRLAFTCFDKDGDGHLTPAELQELLRGTIEPAVNQLHAAIDFASFGSDGDEPDLAAINDEAGAAAVVAAAPSDAGAGTVQVQLQTKAGTATLAVPAAALSADGMDMSALSLDAFLSALVAGAVEKYDADKNGMIEIEEFVQFAKENPFLAAWFGHLSSTEGTKSSWKDDFVVG